MKKMDWISSHAQAVWQVGVFAAAMGEADLALDGRRYQTIKGWGGCFNERGWETLLRMDERS